MTKIFLVVTPAFQIIYRLKHKGNNELNKLEAQQKNVIFYETEKTEKVSMLQYRLLSDFCPV